MPCSERTDPDPDTNIAKTGHERSKETTKGFVMVPNSSVRLAAAALWRPVTQEAGGTRRAYH